MHNNKSHKYRNILIIFVVIVILGGLGTLGYYKYVHNSKKQTSNTTQTKAPPPSLAIPPANQNYDSANIGVSFNYPKGWSITDIIGSNLVTIESPKINFKNAQNQFVKGQITLTINNNTQPTLSAFASGNATAALPSQKITYSQPSSIQQASTYISFLSYDYLGSETGTINGIFVTANLGYTLNQSVPETNIYEVSPIIYLSFTQCPNGICTSNDPVFNLPVSVWQNQSFSKPILSMLESIVINS